MTLPVGYESKDGDYYSFRCFRYPAQQFQLMYGDLAGTNKVFTWSSASWRRTNHSTHRATVNLGRTWQKVTLQLGAWDLVATDVWAKNIQRPTTVYDKALTLPGHTGNPPAKPSPFGFGSAKDQLVVPFDRPYVYVAKQGITVHFTMEGGVLKNGSVWYFDGYYLDAVRDGNMTSGGNYRIVGDNRCTTGHKRAPYWATWLFTDHLPGGRLQHRVQLFGHNFPAHTTAMGVIGFAANPSGSSFLSSCQKLFLDLRKPHLVYAFKTDENGVHMSDFLTAPWIAAAAGATLYTQAGLEHGRPGRLELTKYGVSVVPAPATGKPVSYSQWLYRGRTGTRSGYGPYNTAVPITLFK